MYKIDIKETLYPIQTVLLVYKKFSKTSVFIDRKWPIQHVPLFYAMHEFVSRMKYKERRSSTHGNGRLHECLLAN